MAEPFRALIIDDDPDLLRLVRRTLEFTAGWEVVTAGSGAAGIELARSATTLDVILVDVMMPEIDGYEVCRRLKADAATARVPIVLLTARRDLNQARLADTGAAGVVSSRSSPKSWRARSGSSASDERRSTRCGAGRVRGRAGGAHRDAARGAAPARARLSQRGRASAVPCRALAHGDGRELRGGGVGARGGRSRGPGPRLAGARGGVARGVDRRRRGRRGARPRRARIPRYGAVGQRPLVGGSPRGCRGAVVPDQRRGGHARDLPGRDSEGPARARLPAGQRSAHRRSGYALLRPYAVRPGA